MSVVEPTAYQAMALQVPEQWNLLLGGGRGGGKSTAMLLAVLRHCELYGADARPLVVRETHKALTEIEDRLDELLTAAYGTAVERNRAEHVFRLPNGATVECGQIDSEKAYKKYQGRETTLLCIDELGLFASSRWVDMLKSNLRARPGIPLRVVATANPGGRLHAYVHRTYVAPSVAWRPFEVGAETWVYAPSTLRDNPHVDRSDYERRLKSACGNDEALARAWVEGDWNIARGAFFAGDLDESVHKIAAKLPFQVTPEWRPFVAMDWGSAAPSVTYVCLRAPDNCWGYPRGSLLLIDELATVDPKDEEVGLRWPPDKLAEAIKEMCARWRVRPAGVGDDASGLGETLLEHMRRSGVWLQRPRKERVAGWQAMRQMLAAAKERSGAPGMWVSERCKYFWRTVPYVQRDDSRPEDMETGGADHAADAARYAVMHATRPGLRTGRVRGMY